MTKRLFFFNFPLWTFHLYVSTFQQHIPHSLLVTEFWTRTTRQVPLVDQELLTIPEQPSSPLGFKWGLCCPNFSFMHSILSTIVCLFLSLSFGHCIVCPPSTASDYPFGIFKLFLALIYKIHINISSSIISIQITIC